MELEQAQKILYSDQKFNVLYNGSPVWIESLDRQRGTAMVKLLDDGLDTVREVPVARLLES